MFLIHFMGVGENDSGCCAQGFIVCSGFNFRSSQNFLEKPFYFISTPFFAKCSHGSLWAGRISVLKKTPIQGKSPEVLKEWEIGMFPVYYSCVKPTAEPWKSNHFFFKSMNSLFMFLITLLKWKGCGVNQLFRFTTPLHECPLECL